MINYNIIDFPSLQQWRERGRFHTQTSGGPHQVWRRLSHSHRHLCHTESKYTYTASVLNGSQMFCLLSYAITHHLSRGVV